MTLVRLALRSHAFFVFTILFLVTAHAQAADIHFEPGLYTGIYKIRNVTTNTLIDAFSGPVDIVLPAGDYNVDFGANAGAASGFAFTVTSDSVTMSASAAASLSFDDAYSRWNIGFQTAPIEFVRGTYSGALILSTHPGAIRSGLDDFVEHLPKGLQFRIDQNSGSFEMRLQVDSSGNVTSLGPPGSTTTAGNQVIFGNALLKIRPGLFEGQYFLGSHPHLAPLSEDQDITVIPNLPSKISIGGLGHAGIDFTVPISDAGMPLATGSPAYNITASAVAFNTVPVTIQTTWPNTYFIGGYHNLTGTQTRNLVPVTALILAGGGSGTVSVTATNVSPNPKPVDVAGTTYLFTFNVPGQTPPAVGNIATRKSSVGSPHRIDSDAAGNIYFTDPPTRRVFRLKGTNSLEVIAGGNPNPVLCDQPLPAACADALNVAFGFPIDVAVGPNGNLFVADTGTNRVVILVPTDALATAYRAETYVGQSWQYVDDDLAIKHRLSASLSQPQGVDFSNGKLWVADTWNNRVMEIDPATGMFRTLAGNRGHGIDDDLPSRPAWERSLRFPTDMEAKGDHLWIVDSYNHRLRRVNLVSGNHELETISGSDFWYSGDCGPAFNGSFRHISSLAFDAAGNLYLTDLENHALRRINAGANQLIDATDIIETIAGGIFPGYNGDDIPANTAYLNFPIGVTVHAGMVYVSDAGNGRIRWINPGPSGCQPADTTPPVFDPPSGIPSGWSLGTHVVLNANDGDGSGVASIHYELSGGESGIGDFEASQVSIPVNNEGITTILYYATDVAGNQSEPESAVVQIDRSAPTAECGPAPENWSNVDVILSCVFSDHLSGIVGDGIFSLTTSVAGNTETNNAATGAQEVCDQAGNCETFGPFTGLLVDKRPPTISISSPTATTYVIGQSITTSYSCSDGGSGVASCTGNVPSGSSAANSVGNHTFTVEATDAVGNSSTSQRSYSVGYGICRLYDASKSHRRGSAIPLKIQLCDASGANLSSSNVAVTAVQLVHVSTTATGMVEDTGNANPDSNFRYDSSLGGTGGYIFNLDTSALQAGIWTLRVNVQGDSTAHSSEVVFQIKQ